MSATITATHETTTLADVTKHGRTGPYLLPAALTRVTVEHGSMYLVSLAEQTARYFGAADLDGTLLADRTIGGIVRLNPASSRWGVTAYLDRAGHFDHGGPGGYLPVDAASRTQAVRMLAYWWHLRYRAARDLPHGVTNAQWRRL